MGFKITLLGFTALLPLIMIGFGRFFLKKSPDDINYVFGYRTAMSMKNKDTWIFAHKHIGKTWFYLGLVILPVSVIILLAFFGRDKDTFGNAGTVIILLQLIPLIGSIFPTEAALKKTFDEDGNRR